MANPNPPPPPVHSQFKPGKSGNPGGKPVNARNRLQTKFLYDLADDWDANGKEAIRACREDDPARYVQIVAALMPKQVEETKPLDEFTDEQLIAAIALIRSQVAGGTGAGAGQAGESQTTQ